MGPWGSVVGALETQEAAEAAAASSKSVSLPEGGTVTDQKRSIDPHGTDNHSKLIDYLQIRQAVQTKLAESSGGAFELTILDYEQVASYTANALPCWRAGLALC